MMPNGQLKCCLQAIDKTYDVAFLISDHKLTQEVKRAHDVSEGIMIQVVFCIVFHPHFLHVVSEAQQTQALQRKHSSVFIHLSGTLFEPLFPHPAMSLKHIPRGPKQRHCCCAGCVMRRLLPGD